jgi:hypothetical protein
MINTWHYISTEDMKYFKGKVSDNLYWKLSAQCRARIPMLKKQYIILKNRYEKYYNKE